VAGLVRRVRRRTTAVWRSLAGRGRMQSGVVWWASLAMPMTCMPERTGHAGWFGRSFEVSCMGSKPGDGRCTYVPETELEHQRQKVDWGKEETRANQGRCWSENHYTDPWSNAMWYNGGRWRQCVYLDIVNGNNNQNRASIIRPKGHHHHPRLVSRRSALGYCTPTTVWRSGRLA